MRGRRAAATGSQGGASRSKMVSSTDNLTHVLDLYTFAALAARLMTAMGAERGS
jgi:hypothetical protein